MRAVVPAWNGFGETEAISHDELGLTAERRQELEGEVTILSNLIEGNPENPQFHIHRGHKLFVLGNVGRGDQ